jgi:hypothetical protein
MIAAESLMNWSISARESTPMGFMKFSQNWNLPFATSAMLISPHTNPTSLAFPREQELD